MLIRPTTEADLDQILAWPVTEPVGVVPADRYREELDRHQYRPEWTWIAEDEGRVLARAIWWGFADAAYPLVLDCVSADGSLPAGGPVSGRAVLAARLIAAGQRGAAQAGSLGRARLRDQPAHRLAVRPGRGRRVRLAA